MSLALYRKYRPQTFADIVGQDHVSAILAREVAMDKVAQAYLFSGPRGTGKTSAARILTKAVNCEARSKSAGEPCNACGACEAITQGRALDVLEIDAASYTGVDNVREVIVETAKFAPSQLKHKVFIIDEAHMLSNAAWNALLKIIEEPPAHIIFILATTEAAKVPATILSRCQRFDFHRVPAGVMIERMRRIAHSEKVRIDPKVLALIARLSEGCLRDAESMLEQLVALGEAKIDEDAAALVLPRSSMPLVFQLLGQIGRQDAAGALTTLDRLGEDGADLKQFSKDMLTALRIALRAHIAPDPAFEVDPDYAKGLKEFCGMVSAQRILECIDAFARARLTARFEGLPSLPLEIAAVELCEKKDPPGPSASERSANPVRSSSGALNPAVAEIDRHSSSRQAVGHSASNGAKAAPDSLQDTLGKKARSLPGQKFKTGQPLEVTHSDKAASALNDTARKENAGVSGDGGVSIADIRAKWPQVLSLAQKENHSLPFLLSLSDPLEVRGRTLEVGVKYSLHCDKLNEQKCRTLLRQILRQVYGTDLDTHAVIAASTAQGGSGNFDEVMRMFGGVAADRT